MLSAAAGAMDASGGGQGGGRQAFGAGGSEGPSDAGSATGSAGAAGGCLPCATSCMPVPRIILPVACQGMTGECSGALDCPCHACIETARAAVFLGSGRLGLFLPNGGDAPLVFQLSKSQGPAVTVGSLSSYDWSQAHVVVDPTCLDDYVMVRFPSTPRPLPSSGGFLGCFLYFDRPHGLAEERDAEPLAWAKAEELRQERWWGQRAVAVLLGLHSRVGAISALRVLPADAVRPILRIMRRVSGPGRETDHASAEKAALEGCSDGRPDVRYPEPDYDSVPCGSPVDLATPVAPAPSSTTLRSEPLNRSESTVLSAAAGAMDASGGGQGGGRQAFGAGGSEGPSDAGGATGSVAPAAEGPSARAIAASLRDSESFGIRVHRRFASGTSALASGSAKAGAQDSEDSEVSSSDEFRTPGNKKGLSTAAWQQGSAPASPGSTAGCLTWLVCRRRRG